jgi:hypothetical protein
MHEWLVAITNGTVLVIDVMVLVIIAIGTIQAFVQGLRVMLLPSATGHERRDVWLHSALAGRRPYLPARRRYPRDLNRSELGRTGAPRDRRSDSNFAQLLPRERSLGGSQTAIRACRQQACFRMMQRRRGPLRYRYCFASPSCNTLCHFRRGERSAPRDGNPKIAIRKVGFSPVPDADKLHSQVSFLSETPRAYRKKLAIWAQARALETNVGSYSDKEFFLEAPSSRGALDAGDQAACPRGADARAGLVDRAAISGP